MEMLKILHTRFFKDDIGMNYVFFTVSNFFLRRTYFFRKNFRFTDLEFKRFGIFSTRIECLWTMSANKQKYFMASVNQKSMV